MSKNVTQKGIQASILMLLILGVFGMSLVTDLPFSIEKTEAKFKHTCTHGWFVWNEATQEWEQRSVTRNYYHLHWWNHTWTCPGP